MQVAFFVEAWIQQEKSDENTESTLHVMGSHLHYL
jgi:hypothetical protein